MKYNPVSIIKTVSILKKNKVDITIVNISKDINIGAVASKIASIPVIRRVGLPQDIKQRNEEVFLAKFYSSTLVPSNNLKKAMVKELEVEKNVEFSGFTRNIPEFLSEIDIFVLPSLTENSPNTLMEAMFANLPCIAFNTGGVPEVLGDTGVLIQPKDTEKLTYELEKLIKSPELRESMAKYSKKRALDEFNLTINSPKIEEIFKKAISN